MKFSVVDCVRSLRGWLFVAGLFALAVMLAAPAAFAGFQWSKGVPGISDRALKTPDLTNSDVFSTTVVFHADFPIAKVAGFLLNIAYDTSEVSFVGLRNTLPGPLQLPLGTYLFPPGASTSLPGSTATFNPPNVLDRSFGAFAFWFGQTTASQSGIQFNTSDFLTAFTLQLHAKNTTPANSSDVDFVLSLRPIFHVSQTGTVTLFTSDYVLVNTAFSTIIGPFVTPADFGAGFWDHVSNTTYVPFFGFASNFFAPGSLASTLTLGVEHVPEPASAALLALGLGGLAWSARRQHRAVR